MRQEQAAKDYFHPPDSPIPPLQDTQHRLNISCRYCRQNIMIRHEQISYSDKGKPRFRYVPRDIKTLEIHDCLNKHEFNDTKTEHG